MVNIKSNIPDKSNIGMAASELNDLTRFWDGLSFLERDQSITTVENLLSKTSESELSNIPKKQIEEIYERVKFLTSSNKIEKQSWTKSLIDDPSSEYLTDELEKPDFNQIMKVIQGLPFEEQKRLGGYLGMNEAKLSFVRPAKLDLMYEDILTSSTAAVFFACRNYLGKHYMLK
ncbi:MAG: hypothetical protein SCH66_02060 [Methanolobus sp.]|nr:hypothetical protein [Methanolobus sp.]